MSVDWIILVPSIIFTRIKTNFSEKIKIKHNMTNNNFSTLSKSDLDAVFPFVYVKSLTASEQGRDLQGTSINGALFTFQIEVIDNKKQQNAREVMGEIIRIMKEMGFENNSLPFFEDTNDNTHRIVARFRKMMADED
jgi:hypothetical protein